MKSVTKNSLGELVHIYKGYEIVKRTGQEDICRGNSRLVTHHKKYVKYIVDKKIYKEAYPGELFRTSERTFPNLHRAKIEIDQLLVRMEAYVDSITPKVI